ncbi:hypothetical protein RWE15_11945 [Virgibacillus halophilus]|uniref:Ketopantoate reductase C-terminal domain-containing protein n=1 Tax=Tigheibacillus halophilus TaxID=361280 RepID=A0ABU5C6P8_9BACI|nr:hypothetical protein [Virgibacillus halophilus]
MAVEKFMTGIEQNDIEKLLAGVTLNRKALKKVGQAADVPIETPLLSTLCDLAEKHGGSR